MSTTTLDTGTVRRWKRYPEYRSSQCEWLPEIPSHWRSERLRFLATPSRRRLFEKPENKVYVGLEQVESKTGKLLLDNPVETVESSMGEFEAGDILFGKLRPYLAKVASPRFQGVCTTELAIYRPCSAVYADFLKYQLLSKEIIDFVNSFAYGTKMPRVSEGQLSELRLAVPPLGEQRMIATFLDRETARIDALIGHKERLIALLEEKRQAIISHAVIRGFDRTAPLKDSGLPWLGEIPKHWGIRRLKHISPEQLVGVVVNPSTYVDDQGVVPFLFGSNVLPGKISLDGVRRITNESNGLIAKSILRAGDLVTVRVGAPGMTAVIPPDLDGCNCASIMIIRGSPRFVSDWLCYAMNSLVGKTNVELAQYGAAQEQFNISHAVNFLFPVPPPEEQAAIARRLHRQCEDFDRAANRICDGIARLQEYRTALISGAVTGQIDVRGEVT